MLKLQPNPTFQAAVSIPLPDGSRASIQCEFRWMPTLKLAAFLREAVAASRDRTLAQRIAQALLRGLAVLPLVGAWAAARVVPARSEFDYLNDILVGWSGVDLPWGLEAYERLREQHPAAPSLMVEAWARGLAENRLGN